MNSEAVGMVHQYLDRYVDDNMIKRYGNFWVRCHEKGLVDDMKCAIIGQLYGGGLRLLSNIYGREEESLMDQTLEEYNEIFISKLDGLERKIDSLINNNH